MEIKMRYIKTYKVFESTEDSVLVSEINDILSTLKDDGFGIKCKISNDRKRIGLLIHRQNIFKYSDIQNDIDHVKSYLYEHGFNLSGIEAKQDYQNFITLDDEDKLIQILIKFKKE